MTEMAGPRGPVRFGEFEVDLQARRLFKQGAEVRLREQLFIVLETLIEHAGSPVSRDAFQKRLWPGDTLVDFEINLNTLIARLREALGDSAENPRYIETLPKRGYRFLAETFAAEGPGARPRRRLRLVVLPF
jgi:DNA-binding winged helix-turn-helix (wHTH) protein